MKPIKYLIEQTYSHGLEDLVAGETDISRIDGEAGRLWYRGYNVEELAEKSTFEEVVYLVIHGVLPTESQYNGWVRELEQWQTPPDRALEVLKSLPSDAHAMMLYRTMVSVAACHVPEGENVRLDAQWRRPARLLSWNSTLAAAAISHILGNDAGKYKPGESFTSNFLSRSLDRKFTEFEKQAFDVSLIVQAEHGFNVATLAALTVISTGADLGSAIIAGMSTLAGKQHGGTNQLAFQNLVNLKSVNDAEEWATEKLKEGYRFPGFGHRIYKTHDPRAKILEPFAQKLLRDKNETELWNKYETVRDIVETRLGEKGIYINVGSVSGLIYHALGFPPDSFPIPLALAIQVGWMAHCLEYISEGRIIEPGAIYTG